MSLRLRHCLVWCSYSKRKTPTTGAWILHPFMMPSKSVVSPSFAQRCAPSSHLTEHGIRGQLFYPACSMTAWIECVQVVDFDPESLRLTLPRAVHHAATAIDDGKIVYVHCTAGLGRAPATCIAYLFWFRDFNLDQAYEHLTSIRPCGPSRDAIRGATYDILSGGDWNAFQAVSYTHLTLPTTPYV